MKWKVTFFLNLSAKPHLTCTDFVAKLDLTWDQTIIILLKVNIHIFCCRNICVSFLSTAPDLARVGGGVLYLYITFLALPHSHAYLIFGNTSASKALCGFFFVFFSVHKVFLLKHGNRTCGPKELHRDYEEGLILII